MIVDIAIKTIPRRSKPLVACNGSVSAPRHCDAPRASKAPQGSMARLAAGVIKKKITGISNRRCRRKCQQELTPIAIGE